MALKVTILEDGSKIIARGVIDGTVPFSFEDFGDSWSVQIGRSWQHREHERRLGGQPSLAGARQKIYGAVARFRSDSKLRAA